ncbi:MAG: hypothetical protein AAFQ14_15420 [Cyanobacteria bacterium J06621_12]
MDKKKNKEKLLQKSVTDQLSLSLAALLITISAISVPSLALFQDTKNNFANNIFIFVGLLSIYGAAKIVDYLLDNAGEDGLSFGERRQLLGGGYLYFCIVVSLLSCGLLVLYSAQEGLIIIKQKFAFIVLIGIYLFTGISMFYKFMTIDKAENWGRLVLFFLILSVCLTKILSYFPVLIDSL